MKKLLSLSLAICGAVFTLGVNAADAGRYQAVPIEGEGPARGGNRVLIIDSQEGHVWTWSGNELIGDTASGRRYGSAFIYQGRVRPGSKQGEVIELPAK